LATVDEQGNPDARFVLLRGLDDAGLVFYTNGEQREGQAAGASPVCDAGVLVGRAGATDSATRAHRAGERRGGGRLLRAPSSRGHQLAAWVSPQSEPIPSRAWLEQRAAEVEREFDGRAVPRPPYWTGYRLVPDAIEFWQGRRNRLHDRILFTRQPDGGWTRVRLAP
jgi:pyridoxamine 5'-phosphate oxidase